jgi:hypothetical protein
MSFAHLPSILSQALSSLDEVLAVGHAFACEQQLDEAALLQRRLAPDMLCLARQVEIVADGARGAVARLTGQLDAHDERPAHAVFNRGDDAGFGPMPASFEALRGGVDQAQRDIAALAAAAGFVDAQAVITVARGGQARVFAAQAFVDRYLLPNLYFHLSIAYALLRAAGAPLGKHHFEGAPAYQLQTLR